MSRPTSPGDFMTVAEFGARLGVSRTSAWRLVAAEEVEAINVGSRKRPRLRISEAAYEAYAKRKKVAGIAA